MLDSQGDPRRYDRLLEGTEPWRGAGDVASNLLLTWIKQFQLKQCAWMWIDSVPEQAHCLAWKEDEKANQVPAAEQRPAEDSSGEFPVKLVQLTHFVRERASGIPLLERDLAAAGLSWDEMNWRPLMPNCGEDQEPIFIALDPSNAWDRIDDSWRKISSRLLRWAMKFELELRDRKLEAMAEYAAGAGHEINNPLGSIIGRTSQLLKGEVALERRRLLETIGAQAYRIRDMIGDTMLFARPPRPECRKCDLVPLILEVIQRFQESLTEKSLALRREMPSDCEVFADPEQVRIVVAELLRNAIHAAPEGSEISLKCEQVSESPHLGVRMTVEDHGPEMSAEEMEHCFDPFYSGRSAGRGLGFGLSKCWRIMQQLNGRIQLLRKAKTTVAVVSLPAADSISED